MDQQATAAPETGYAPVNGMQMYYELHGAGGTPLLLFCLLYTSPSPRDS